MRGGNESGAVGWPQTERGHQQIERLGARGAVDAAFEVADGADADTSAARQRFLSQARQCAVAPEQRAERMR